MPFEIQALPATGSITANVQDPSGQVPELTIIQIADAWSVRVQWSISGAAVPAFAPGALWHVNVALESLGPGLEAIVGQITEPMGPPALSHNYDRTVNIPGNFPGLVPGAYKLTTVVTLENGGVPCPLAGYVEGPVLQFYQFP